jgi:hypothetical protein
MKKVYTVHDGAAGAYLEPFFCRSHAEAIRSFSGAVNGADHIFNQHPDDFHLFYIGDYDEDTGVISSSDHLSLGCAVEFLASPRLVKEG